MTDRLTCPTCHGCGTVPTASNPARPTDPDTSHAGASRHATTDVRRFSARSRQAALLRWFCSHSGTAQQAALSLWPDAGLSTLEGARRRVSDLVRAGFLTDSGTRAYNPGSPDPSIVWTVSIAGIFRMYDIDYPGEPRNAEPART